MFAAWGRFVHRFRWPVLAASAALLVASGFIAAQGARLEAGGFIETAESGRASRLIERELPRAGAASFTVIYSSPTLSADDPAFRGAVERALSALRGDPRVATIETPYTAADPSRLISKDARAVAVNISVNDRPSAAQDYYPELRDKVRSDVLASQATGVLAIEHGFNQVLQTDLRRAETVSLPLAAILLLIVFGTVVAALIPLGVGILAVMGGVAGMFLLARVTNVSVYAENVVTLIGLGVAIDYSLFVTNRFREELHRGRSTQEASAIALATSGRAITFSGLTVAIGLTGMLFYQGTYLASMGLAGAIVVASAVFYGLTFLPALLSVLGRRVDLIAIPVLRARTDGVGAWHRLATAVMRRPLAVLVPLVALLALVGSPFLRIHLANGDVTMLPKHEESRAAYDRLVADFAGAGQTHIAVAVSYDGSPLTAQRIPQLVDLQKKLEALPRVQRVNSAFALDPRLGAAEYTALYATPPAQRPPQLQALVQSVGEPRLAAIRDATLGPHMALFDVVTAEAAYSDAAHGIVEAARALPAPAGSQKLVGGFTAIDLDTVAFIKDHTPAALAYVMLATALVLFLLLGSVVLPIKAVVMNLLSITASFGALVWVFQEGNLSDVLGFTATGGLDPTLPVIMFSTIFGLSMDYEVLLLSRVQEEYVRLGDNTLAVAEGLERSGRLITGAAAIMVAVFAAFGLAEIMIIKAIGLGMALAVAIDATIVRALVVPATMRLLGRANWWAPGPLARLYRHLRLGEAHSLREARVEGAPG